MSYRWLLIHWIPRQKPEGKKSRETGLNLYFCLHVILSFMEMYVENADEVAQ